MFTPVQRDHESCCPNCGCVLANVEEVQEAIPSKPIISANLYLLGSAMDKNVKHSLRRTSHQLYEERALRQLESIVRHYKLPEIFIIESLNLLKKKNWGIRSEKEPIKALIKILSKDDNYMHINKLRMIKARYEDILNH